MKPDARDRLVVALDVGSAAEAESWVARLGDAVLWYKVGLELFIAAGPELVTRLKAQGKHLFLDLKLHDIPNTVARAAWRAAQLGVDLIDLHVTAGEEALRAAAERVREACPAAARPRLLGVTVLTSTRSLAGEPLTAAELAAEAGRRAARAAAAGLDGVVAPVSAAEAVRAAGGADFLLLTPGIRPRGAARGDQQWIATPAEAVRAGARWLVVGRPITAAADPLRAVQTILAEMEQAGTAGRHV